MKTIRRIILIACISHLIFYFSSAVICQRNQRKPPLTRDEFFGHLSPPKPGERLDLGTLIEGITSRKVQFIVTDADKERIKKEGAYLLIKNKKAIEELLAALQEHYYFSFPYYVQAKDVDCSKVPYQPCFIESRTGKYKNFIKLQSKEGDRTITVAITIPKGATTFIADLDYWPDQDYGCYKDKISGKDRKLGQASISAIISQTIYWPKLSGSSMNWPGVAGTEPMVIENIPTEATRLLVKLEHGKQPERGSDRFCNDVALLNARFESRRD